MDCVDCEYYDTEDEVCGAFECYGIERRPLPCEERKK